ncbi:hypothetical protein TH9_06220 [Thalassospira xiamenensis]|nr:hypothetical protein AUP41_16330 [Thalassospira xiamenensis]RCK33995.1 hypothetical protein TH9_06220 [Thalassospira xiamenensis]
MQPVPRNQTVLHHIQNIMEPARRCSLKDIGVQLPQSQMQAALAGGFNMLASILGNENLLHIEILFSQ